MTIKTIFAALILSGCANFLIDKHTPVRHWQAPPKLAIDYTDQKPVPKRDLSDVPFKYYTDEELEDFISQEREERADNVATIKLLQAVIEENDENLENSIGVQDFRKLCADHQHRPEECEAEEKYDEPEPVQQLAEPKKVDKGSGLFFENKGRRGRIRHIGRIG